MKPMLSYLVCATPRSGSTLLCHELDQTGLAGHPQEYFEALRRSGVPRRPHEYFDPDRHPNIVERLAFREMLEDAPTPNPLWHPETYDQYLDWALGEGATANGVFGAKLMWGYLGDFAELLRGIEGNAGRSLPELLSRTFPGLRYVQITREDKVRQAVSLWKAVQTQKWRRDAGDDGGEARAGEPVFSFRAINYLMRQLTAHDASWDAYFLGLGYEPLKVTYEELAESTDAVVRSVLDFLGIAAPADLQIGAPRLSVQADAVSEEWVARVLEHLQALEEPEPV
ncbi:MAG TPA: Stf0 family sulfotransferase [Solirubrobacteraceae bacterium]|nr:Stf0 family sulfotransferase [Solirubrobacteraceae bacterium]